MNIETDVIEILAELTESEVSDLSMTTRLEALHLDSILFAELLFAIEERHDIRIAFNANDTGQTADSIQTIGDIVNQIKGLVQKS